MGRTHRERWNTVIEIVRRDDGLYDLLRNRRLEREGMTLSALEYEICVRFGFCQEELKPILRDIEEHGTTKLPM